MLKTISPVHEMSFDRTLSVAEAYRLIWWHVFAFLDSAAPHRPPSR
jgi:hypothetical protein